MNREEFEEKKEPTLIKIAKKGNPVEHMYAAEKVVHNRPCQIKSDSLYATFNYLEGGDENSYVIKEKKNGLSIYYLAGLFQSNLFKFYAKNSGQPLINLPVKKPEFSKPLDKYCYENIIRFAKELERLADKNPAEAEHDAKKFTANLNRTVEKLYGLTKKETKTVDFEFAQSEEDI